MKRIWTEQERQYLVDNYPDMNTTELAKKMNRTYSSITCMAYILKLKKSDEYLNDPVKSGRLTYKQGLKTRFKKGMIPHNKGKKMPKKVYDKCKATMFKKGQTPHNAKYNGAISIRDGYKYIRIEQGEWVLLHRLIYEKHHGEIPADHNIIFKDKNPNNCDISNLELISNEDLMLKNSYLNYPDEIVKLIKTKAVLTRTINSL